MKKLFASISPLLLVTSLCLAQFSYQFDQSIPLSITSENVRMPWSGGLNSAQINTIDLDGDGQEDVVIYDKTNQAIIPLLRKNGRYEFAPDYAYFFPDDIEGFLILRDFNGNGKKDLFTATQLGIRVYENIGNSLPVWRLKAPFIEVLGQSGNLTNLQVSQDDIPAITDLDGDGDLDILAFTFTGFDSFVRYYKNMSVENNGHAEELEFELVSSSWGDFQECDCGTYAFGEEDCDFGFKLIEQSAVNHAMHPGGKSMLLLDFNGDGIKDLFASHEECEELYVLENLGENNENALIRNLQNGFPADQPANFPYLPSPYYEDVDGDGIKDLIVSPNMLRNLANRIDFANSLWFYKNTGSNSLPEFEFRTTAFLQEDMLDLGENAAPYLYDMDGDGDLDLLVAANAHNGNDELIGKVFYFENKGSQENPEFVLVDKDLWSLSQQQLTDIQLQLNDMNADGKADLILTALQNGANRSFVIYQNQDLTSFDFNQSNTIIGLPSLVGYQILAHDLTADGQAELFYARPSGGLDVYALSNGAELNYERIISDYLGISDDFFKSNLRIQIADLNGDGKQDMISIDRSGRIQIYPDFSNFNPNLDEVKSTILYEKIGDRFTDTALGNGNQLSVGLLTDDSFPALIVGSRLGGLYLLRNTEDLPLPKKRKLVRIYPNPVNEGQLNVLSEINTQMDILSMDGKLISGGNPIIANENNSFDVSYLQANMYLARFKLSGGKFELLRFIVR